MPSHSLPRLYIYYHPVNERLTSVVHEGLFPASSQLPVATFYVDISYATSVSRSRYNLINTQTSNISQLISESIIENHIIVHLAL